MRAAGRPSWKEAWLRLPVLSLDQGVMHLVKTPLPSGQLANPQPRWASCIAKPFNVDVLKVTVAKLLEMRRLREEPTDEDTRSP